MSTKSETLNLSGMFAATEAKLTEEKRQATFQARALFPSEETAHASIVCQEGEG